MDIPARQHCCVCMKYYLQAVRVDWKAPGDPVTAADREASDLIVSHLLREFPQHVAASCPGVVSFRLPCEVVHFDPSR